MLVDPVVGGDYVVAMATTPGSLTLARDAWAALAELFLAQRPAINAAMADLGLHPVQALALRMLEPGEPRPMSALAAMLHCDASNVTNIADRLEAAGLVVRQASAQDRRVKTLLLTPKGVDMRDRVTAIWHEPPAAIAALPDADLEALLDVLSRTLGR
jgi:MarR family transcriptional regulator, organic hydroperoxide resistance regulator